MSYTLKQALLLSSKGQAYFNIRAGMIVVDYRLIAEANEHGCTLKIYHVSYAEGGAIRVADEPHRIIEKPYFENLESFLQEYGFVTDNAWLPVEEEAIPDG